MHTLKLVIGGALILAGLIYPGLEFSRRGPRGKLTVSDWLPRSWLGNIAFICAGLLYAGGWVLFGRHQTFRLGGALALAGGAVLLWLIIRYVRRPVMEAEEELPPKASDAALPPFTRMRPGYNRQAVDDFFDHIFSKSQAEIEAVRFTRSWRGYDMHEVDRSLDAWALRQRPPI